MYATYFSRDPVPLKESFAIQEKFSVEMWEISLSFPLKLQGKTEPIITKEIKQYILKY